MNAPVKPAAWTEMDRAQKKAAVLPLAKEGKSYDEIARILDASSRNSISTIFRALREDGLLPAVTRETKIQSGKAQARRINPGHANLHAVNIAHKAESRQCDPGHVEPTSPPSPPETRKLTLVELTETTCRWPIGDPRSPDFHFCGADALPTKPYCPFHEKLAWTSSRHDERKEPA